MKKLSTVLLAAILCFGTAFPAQAATYTIIDTVTLDFHYEPWISGEYHDEGEVNVTCDDEGCYVDMVEMTNQKPGEWKKGDVPMMKVTLFAKDGYKFGDTTAGPDGVYCNNATPYNSARTNYSEILYVFVKLNPVEANGWEDVPVNQWPSLDGVNDGTWVQDARGWKYINKDRSIRQDDWEKISGKWYFFDKDGYMLANKWVLWKEQWYYLGADGAMLAGTWTPDHYYVGPDGAWNPNRKYPGWG